MQKAVDAKLLEFIKTNRDAQCVVLDNYAQDLSANELINIDNYIKENNKKVGRLIFSQIKNVVSFAGVIQDLLTIFLEFNVGVVEITP